jgi:hypothetical protein
MEFEIFISPLSMRNYKFLAPLTSGYKSEAALKFPLLMRIKG